MKRRLFGAIGLTIASALTITGCSTAGDDADESSLTTIKVAAQSVISAESLYLGIAQGYFEDEGLDVELVDVPDQTAAFAALQSGGLDFTMSPFISVLQSARQGMPISIVAAADGMHPDLANAVGDEKAKYTSVSVNVNPESGITDMAGLAGATIAIPIVRSQADATIIWVLRNNGVDTSGINWLNLDFVSALGSLKDNQIDAAFLVSPFALEAAADGLTPVMYPSAEFFEPGSAVSGWLASNSFIDSNPDVIAAFQRAMARSAEYATDNLEIAKQSLIDRTGTELTADQLPISYWPTSVSVADVESIDEKLMELDFFDSPLDVSTIVADQVQ